MRVLEPRCPLAIRTEPTKRVRRSVKRSRLYLVAGSVVSDPDGFRNLIDTRINLRKHPCRRLNPDDRSLGIPVHIQNRIRLRNRDIRTSMHISIRVPQRGLNIKIVRLPPRPQILIGLVGVAHAETLNSLPLSDAVNVQTRVTHMRQQFLHLLRHRDTDSLRPAFRLIIRSVGLQSSRRILEARDHLISSNIRIGNLFLSRQRCSHAAPPRSHSFIELLPPFRFWLVLT